MKITGSHTIDAPRDQVWAALNDIEVLARIVPGCERLVQVGENEFEGTVKIGVQAIKGTYSGKIRLEDVQPPQHYRLVASGRSAGGVVDGAGDVDLAEQDDKTVLRYSGDAQIGGTLASVGQRLIEGASRQLINQSVKALVEQIKTRASQPAVGSEQSAVGSQQAAEEPATALGEADQAAPAADPLAPSPAAKSLEDAAAPAAEEPATALAEADQAGPGAPFEAAPRPSAAPPAPSTITPQRVSEMRTVIVPEDEQLRPESVVRGIVSDMLADRPWFPWVIVAFLLGYLLARRRG